MSPNTAFTLNSANPKFYEQKFLKKKLPAIQTATTKPTKPGVSFKIGFEPDSAMPDSALPKVRGLHKIKSPLTALNAREMQPLTDGGLHNRLKNKVVFDIKKPQNDAATQDGRDGLHRRCHDKDEPQQCLPRLISVLKRQL